MVFEVVFLCALALPMGESSDIENATLSGLGLLVSSAGFEAVDALEPGLEAEVFACGFPSLSGLKPPEGFAVGTCSSSRAMSLNPESDDAMESLSGSTSGGGGLSSWTLKAGTCGDRRDSKGTGSETLKPDFVRLIEAVREWAWMW